MSAKQKRVPKVPKVLEIIRTAASDCRALNNTAAANELLDASSMTSALLEALKLIADNDTYKSEYDGRMYTHCHGCEYHELRGHATDCNYEKARAAIAKAQGGAA